jgi:hypothetical protein
MNRCIGYHISQSLVSYLVLNLLHFLSLHAAAAERGSAREAVRTIGEGERGNEEGSGLVHTDSFRMQTTYRSKCRCFCFSKT